MATDSRISSNSNCFWPSSTVANTARNISLTPTLPSFCTSPSVAQLASLLNRDEDELTADDKTVAKAFPDIVFIHAIVPEIADIAAKIPTEDELADRIRSTPTLIKTLVKMMRQESTFGQNIVSYVGAVGMLQMMPESYLIAAQSYPELLKTLANGSHPFSPRLQTLLSKLNNMSKVPSSSFSAKGLHKALAGHHFPCMVYVGNKQVVFESSADVGKFLAFKGNVFSYISFKQKKADSIYNLMMNPDINMTFSTIFLMGEKKGRLAGYGGTGEYRGQVKNSRANRMLQPIFVNLAGSVSTFSEAMRRGKMPFTSQMVSQSSRTAKHEQDIGDLIARLDAPPAHKPSRDKFRRAH